MLAVQFQSIGDRLTTALISGRFDLYRSLMKLPLRIAPRDGTAYVLKTEQALEDDFNLYHSVIKAHSVTDVFRQLQRSEPNGPDGLMLVCTTHIMANAYRIVDPFKTRLHLVAHLDGWLIQGIESSEGHIRWTLGRAEIQPDGQFESTSRQQERDGDAET